MPQPFPNPRIVFFGTPDFAAASLRALVETGCNVVGVVTATDKYGGRGGKQLIESAVKKYAVEQGLPILQPPNLKRESFVEALRAWKADLQVVVAFRMLPRIVWEMPEIGTFNAHGSLLPKYRGAAPINWAVVNGEAETGVTTFFLKHEIDTGSIIMKRSIPIGRDETAGEVYAKLMDLAAELVIETVHQISRGIYELQPQDESQVSHAPKLYKETAELSFDQSPIHVHNFVRGMNPFPGSWTMLDGKMLKIMKVKPLVAIHDLEINILKMHEGKPVITCVGGFVELLSVKLEGKRLMSGTDFANGIRLTNQGIILQKN